MRGDLLIGQHPRFGERERAGADGRGDLRTPRLRAQPRQGAWAGQGTIGHAAGHDQHVARRRGVEIQLRQQAQPRAGARRLAVCSDRAHVKQRRSGGGRQALVHARGGGEHLVGAGEIQRLHAIEGQDVHRQRQRLGGHGAASSASATLQMRAKRPASTVQVRATMSAAGRGRPSGCTMSKVSVAVGT